MKKKIKNGFIKVMTFMTIMLANMNMNVAHADSKFDLDGAKKLTKGYSEPILSYLMWILPTACAIACLVVGIKWYIKDEDEKERHKPGKTIKNIIILGIVCECIVIILSIVGIK